MGERRVVVGHRLIGDPVPVDFGFEVCCACGQTEWSLVESVAVRKLAMHMDAADREAAA